MTSIPSDRRLQSQHTTFIPAAPYDVVETIRDPETWGDWVDKNTRFDLVEKRSDTDYVSYMRQKGVPWLRIKDRDVVLRSQIARDGAGALHLTGDATEHATRPPLHRVIRMPAMHCQFDVVPKGEGSEVTYAVDLDMGGRIPMWLKRMVTNDIAPKTLGDLSRYLEETGPRGPSALQAVLEPRAVTGAKLGAAVGSATQNHP